MSRSFEYPPCQVHQTLAIINTKKRSIYPSSQLLLPNLHPQGQPLVRQSLNKCRALAYRDEIVLGRKCSTFRGHLPQHRNQSLLTLHIALAQHDTFSNQSNKEKMWLTVLMNVDSSVIKNKVRLALLQRRYQVLC